MGVFGINCHPIIQHFEAVFQFVFFFATCDRSFAHQEQVFQHF